MVGFVMKTPERIKGSHRPIARPQMRPSPLHFLACSVLGGWFSEAAEAQRRDDVSATGAHRFLPILMLTCISLEEQGLRLGAAMHFDSYLRKGGATFATSPTIQRTIRQCIDRCWMEISADGLRYHLTAIGIAEVMNGTFQDSLWLVAPHVKANGGWHDGVFINDGFGRKLIQEASSPWFLVSDLKLREALLESAFKLAAATECCPYYEFDRLYTDTAELLFRTR